MNLILTDTLQVEYVELPFVDLSLRFLYRFTAPVPTVWTEGKIFPTTGSKIQDQAKVTDYVRGEWERILFNELATLPEEYKWMSELKTTTLTECDITPKANQSAAEEF